MSKKSKLTISKVDAVIQQLDAAIFLMLSGFDPHPVHTLIWASRRIIWDLHKTNTNPVVSKIENAITRRVKSEYIKEWRLAENRAANFLKHADLDPEEILDGVDIERINEMYLIICSISLSHLITPIPQRITIGLAYCGFRAGIWLDFEGLCMDLDILPDIYKYCEEMNESKRADLMLESYRHLLKTSS